MASALQGEANNLLELVRAYPWAFWSTVVFPVVVAVVAVVAAIFNSLGGLESLKARLVQSQSTQQILDGVRKLGSDDSERKTTLRLLESYDEKLTVAGKRDGTLKAIISQYQRLTRAASLFAQWSPAGDSSSQQGKIASEILNVLNQSLVQTQVLDDFPGKPLMIELEPNMFHVIAGVPMVAPPKLTFTGLPTGVTPIVTDNTNIGFTVSFVPPSIPVKLGSFGVRASAEF